MEEEIPASRFIRDYQMWSQFDGRLYATELKDMSSLPVFTVVQPNNRPYVAQRLEDGNWYTTGGSRISWAYEEFPVPIIKMGLSTKGSNG